MAAQRELSEARANRLASKLAAETESHEAHIRRLEKELAALRADISSYEIIDVEEIGNHLVLKVKYFHPDKRVQPGCTFEGVKVMVFKDVTMKDALMWRAIDPHFSEPGITKYSLEFGDKVSPSPVARFPGNDEGWEDAICFAKRVMPTT